MKSITVVVTLEVIDFDLFERFERDAAIIMKQYGGKIVSAFETRHELDGSGEEIHVLEFPSEEAFGRYRADRSLTALSGLREQAISSTKVQISILLKSY